MPVAETQPDILMIIADQMRADCLSLENHPVLRTPTIDQIGASGVHFTRAYTSCASCIATRRSLLTGLHPSSHKVVGYEDGHPITTPTFPRLLLEHGYDTAFAGRHMHQYPYEESYGFGRLRLGTAYVDDDDYARDFERALPESGGIKSMGLSFDGFHAMPWSFPDHLHPTTWAVTQARKLIAERHEAQPLFLCTSFYAPHSPLCPPRFYFDRYFQADLPDPIVGSWAVAPDSDESWRGVDAVYPRLSPEARRCMLAGHYGLIGHIDDQIYWLANDFKRSCEVQGRPWVVIFLSDHGDMLGDHHYHRKCEPYESSTRVPLLIDTSLPGMGRGITCDHVVCHEDLMPTVLELAGVPVPDGLDGRSLVGCMQGVNEPIRDMLHGEHAPIYRTEQGYHMLIDGSSKYVWRPHDGSEQLFDLVGDPHELADLAGDLRHAGLLEEMRARLVERLSGRPEGFVVDGQLVAGCRYGAYIGT